MKQTLLIITALMLIVGCGSDSIKLDINNLIDRGGVMYAPNDDKPFTGIVFDFYENGEKELDGNYRKGLMNGEWTYYHENGQIHGEGRFIDGDGSNLSELSGVPFNGRTGRWNVWFKNGQKESEGTYKNGKEDGKWTRWYENGQKRVEKNYKDGEEIGSTDWEYYSNGQKRVERNYKDGKEDGKWTYWYEDGREIIPNAVRTTGTTTSAFVWFFRRTDVSPYTQFRHSGI